MGAGVIVLFPVEEKPPTTLLYFVESVDEPVIRNAAPLEELMTTPQADMFASTDPLMESAADADALSATMHWSYVAADAYGPQ